MQSTGLRWAEHLAMIGGNKECIYFYSKCPEDAGGSGRILRNLRETGCEDAHFWVMVLTQDRSTEQSRSGVDEDIAQVR
jgi:hypothetical protein